MSNEKILAQRPGESLPNIMSTGELEGAYRLLNNEHVSWRDMLQPHVQGTRKRVVEQEGGDVLVVHDSHPAVCTPSGCGQVR